MAAAPRVPVGQLLVDAGILDPAALEAVLEVQRETGMPIGRLIVARGLASADAVATALAEQYGRLVRSEFGLHAVDPMFAPGSIGSAHADELAELRRSVGELEVKLATRRRRLAELEAEIAAETASTAVEREVDWLLPPPEPLPTEEPKVPRLGELLVGKGLVEQRQMADAILESRNTNTLLGRVLLHRGLIFEDDLARCLSEQWQLEFVSLMRVGVDRAAVRMLPKKIGLEFATIPVRYTDRGAAVAFADPSDEDALAAVESFVDRFTPVVAVLSDIVMMWRSVPD